VRAPADLAQGLVQRLRQLTTQEVRDLGDHRAAVSGMAARLAAERAQPDEVENLTRQVERLRAATTTSERRRADTQLSIEVAAAAQSPRLTREELRLRAEVGDLLWLQLDEADHVASVRDRSQLVEAIGRGEPARARELAELHVAADTARLLQLRLRLSTSVASESLGHLVEQLEQVFGGLDVLAHQLAALVADAVAANERLGRDDLAALRPAIFDLLDTHRGLIAGSGVIMAPDLLRDAPRWLEWWWTTATGTAEALRVNLDPAAPDFYDYTTADWYAVPARTLERRIAGPYVDYFCTNEYTLTLSTPVWSGGSDGSGGSGGELLGMAAADVLVASLERQVLPMLASLPRPVVLAGADGRVIASNSPHWAPGQRLSLGADARVTRLGRDLPASGSPSPLRSWMLVEVGEPADEPAVD